MLSTAFPSLSSPSRLMAAKIGKRGLLLLVTAELAELLGVGVVLCMEATACPKTRGEKAEFCECMEEDKEVVEDVDGESVVALLSKAGCVLLRKGLKVL